MRCLIGGRRAELGGDFDGGYYFEPTVLKGDNKVRVFLEEIFGPVLAVTTFKDEAAALEIANNTAYGLGAGVWTRNGDLAYRMGRAIKAARVGRTATTSTRPGRLRWLQDLGRRPREPPDDARALLTDQEPAGQLQHEAPRVLLTGPALEPTDAPHVRTLQQQRNKREVLR